MDGKMNLRERGNGKPIVSFAGWSTLSTSQYFKTFIKELPLRLRSIFDSRYKTKSKGVLWRKKVIKILRKSSQIESRILSRNSFSANPKTAKGDMKVLQKEMVDIILQGDYALDIRGDANNSARFFEILSLGRIPIIIDTERNFPFSDKVDYSSFALIVDFREINNLPNIISDFHKNLSPEKFKEMQINARNAYVNYFRIDAVMKYIVGELRERIK